MYYLDETEKNVNADILRRKEFKMLRQTKKIDNIIPRYIIKDSADKNNYLELNAYQIFVSNYINPNTRFSRLLIKWETGMGKTIGAISIALNFIRYYQKQEEFRQSQDKDIGFVYIIGFTKQIFMDEMLRFPELGFISRAELEKYNKLKKNASGNDKEDIDRLKKFNIMLKKRLHNRIGNGFFRFIGYKELSNHLFLTKEQDIKSESEDGLNKLIEEKKVTVNKNLLGLFSNSLLICDEIHNVYNSISKNNWGTAIQYILNHHASCRAVFLSATPVNNQPSEVIDLLNLLLPRQHYPVLSKGDFFDKDGGLISTKEAKLKEYFTGRISYIRNRNIEKMATKSFMGEEIKGIDYLKFVRCFMNESQLRANKTAMELKEEQDLYYLSDFCIPSPDKRCIYNSKSIRELLSSASQEWKSKQGINYNPKKDIVTGSALKNRLADISPKYSKMIENIKNNIKNRCGKIFIYHNDIHMSGVMFIQEILLYNGIIGENDASSDGTLCFECCRERSKHKEAQISITDYDSKDHRFVPVRFVIVHSNLDKRKINASLEKYNSINNVDGSRHLILLGSRMMGESHNTNSVRNIYVMSRPNNISALVQIIGRALRLNAHKHLPIKERHVNIFIYVSSAKNFMTYEENKYKEKIRHYKIIQVLERIMHEGAIDSITNYDMIWKGDTKKDELSILPYNVPAEPKDMNLSTFNVFYAKFEVEYISYMIKRLFIEYSAVWSYDDLLKSVEHPPFDVEIDTALISEKLFNIALSTLMYPINTSFTEPTIQRVNDVITDNLVDKLYNIEDKIFYVKNGIEFVLIQVDKFYVLAPMSSGEIIYEPEALYRCIRTEREHMMEIGEYLRHDMNSNYHNKKDKFIRKWENISINQLDLAICDFGVKFHQQLIEDIIEYIVSLWIGKTNKKDEHHNFYIKMLYYYDIHKLMAWAHTVNSKITERYKNYIIPVTVELLNNKLKKDISNMGESSGMINLLISSINKNDPKWISTGMVADYEQKTKLINDMFDGIYRKKNYVKKVKADLMPIGHFLNKNPKFYMIDEGWREYPDYSTVDEKTRENDIIIGYDARSKAGLSVKFKLRSPNHIIKQHRDARMIEKGALCLTKSKPALRELSKKLDIVDANLNNVVSLCQQIRTKLIYNELKARINKTGIRWFYFIYENA
jgi:hypothetical protein